MAFLDGRRHSPPAGRVRLTGRWRALVCGLAGIVALPAGCDDRSHRPRADASVDTVADSAVESRGDGSLPSPGMQFACGSLLSDSFRLLRTLIDRDTGLPYDQMPCGGPYAGAANGFNRAFGVFPQLAYGRIDTFTEDAGAKSAVTWSFSDAAEGGELPDLFYSLAIGLILRQALDGGQGNRFGGIIWGANTSLKRYATVRVRYRTESSTEVWQLKLNAGSPSKEAAVDLPPSRDGWTERTFSLRDDFAGLDLTKVNYIVVATSMDRAGPSPKIWLDRVAFQLDTTEADVCDVSCNGGPYLDLSCYEPQTGAVDIANALTAFAVAPDTGYMTAAEAQAAVAKILGALEAMPVRRGWMTDWHSPVSGVADPRNPVASLTDQPQLYAALMVVETSMPDLASRAAALRARFDFAALYDGQKTGTCAGALHWATDTCQGVLPGTLAVFGNDSLLGEFLAVASGSAPACLWPETLAQSGCSLDGPESAPWYTTGRFCLNPDLPGSDGGGPFLQLAGLLYLESARIPMGSLSLGDSAMHMLASQATYAARGQLPLFGWSNASDPDRCEYLGCGALCSGEPGTSRLCQRKVTPYVSAMALDLMPEIAADNLAAFAAAGAAAPFRTETRSYPFGLRDAWNITTGHGRDAFLYLDTGWSVLGLLNGCQAGLIRRRFAGHAVAQAGYDALAEAGPACAARGCDTLSNVRVADQGPSEIVGANAPVRVEWSPSACPAVVQAYHDGALVYPTDDPHRVARSGVELPLTPQIGPYELKVWVPSAAMPTAVTSLRVGHTSPALDEQVSEWRACMEDPAAPCDGARASCCAEAATNCSVAEASEVADSVCSALRLTRTGPGNCHFYLNLPAATASALSLSLRFQIADRGTCNNDGAPSNIQAVEFSTSAWTGTTRHEWALQWENVADPLSSGAPAWRLWQSGGWTAAAGIPGGAPCPAEGEWHRLQLDGVVDKGQATYARVSIDCQELDLTGVKAKTTADDSTARLATAVQLDVAAGAPAYSILIDDVNLRVTR